MLSGSALGWLLSIAMIAIVALTWGGVKQVRNPEERKRGWLMLIAALVLFGNVLIWVVPL